MSSFSSDPTKREFLHSALQAFNISEQHSTLLKENPDLHFNRAEIYKYLGKLQDAYQEYTKAYLLDSFVITFFFLVLHFHFLR